MDELSSLSHRSLSPTSSALAEADRGPHGRPPLLRLEPAAKARDLLQMFLRRRWLIVLMLVTLNIFAVLAIHFVKPRYTAEASLIIGPRQAQILDLKTVLAGLSGDSEVIESEVQLLRSRRVVTQVVRSLHLEDNPEFNPPSTGPGLLQTLQTKVVGSAIRLWNRFGPARWALETLTVEAASTPVSKRDPIAIATDNALRHTSINPKGHSRVISVSFDSGDPALSARVANDIVTTYIADQLNAKRDATANARKWLDDRVGEMREQVVNADRAVADYRQRAGIIRSRTGNLLNEQISAVGEQYIQAQTARAAAQSRVQASRSGGAMDNLPDATVSPLVQSLRGQQATLMAQIAEMTRTYGPDFPKLVGTRAALGAIEGRIGAELGKSSGSLQQDL
ncbi:MAG: GumC family protein, partial [Janthinobacterium lividum]